MEVDLDPGQGSIIELDTGSKLHAHMHAQSTTLRGVHGKDCLTHAYKLNLIKTLLSWQQHPVTEPANQNARGARQLTNDIRGVEIEITESRKDRRISIKK